tara:strand:- start:454 stop:687 length:234 start_codon:yes stop_codon:yes gene_type:complete
MEKHEIKEVVEETIEEVLEKFGLNPTEIQEAQRDFIYLRTQRILHEKISFRIRVIMWGLVISGIVSMVALGFKSFFK